MQENKSFWADPSRENRYSIGDYSPHQEKITAFLRDRLPERTSGIHLIIVDFGTFTGRNIPVLQDVADDTTVIGTDIGAVEKELKIAREKNPRAAFVETDLDAIAFRDQSIDWAFCWRVLHNLSNLEKIQAALAEIHRVLKENSPCIISVRSATNIDRDAEIGDTVRVITPLPHGGERTDWYFTKSSLTEYMERAGFTVMKVEEVAEGEQISGENETHTYLTCYAVKPESQ